MATLTPRGQRGITLIEIVLWCAIVAAAVVAVFVFGKKASVTAAVETEQRQVADIVRTVEALFATKSDFSALGTNAVLAAKYLQEHAPTGSVNLVKGAANRPELRTQLGGGDSILRLSAVDLDPMTLSVITNTTKNAFFLRYSNVSAEECTRLITAITPISVRSDVGYYTGNPDQPVSVKLVSRRGRMTLTPDKVTERCTAPAGQQSYVTFYFMPARAISATTPTTPPPAARCAPVHETQNVSCPSGQTGTVTQERDGTCTGPGNSMVYTVWATTNDTCQDPVTPPPTVTPPSSPDDCTVATYTRVLACPIGQIGQVVQARDHDTCAGTYTPWTTTSNSCQPSPPANTCTPSTSQLVIACPAGQGGQIVQERSSTCATPTSPPTWSPPNVISNTCTASCSQGGANCCQVQRQTRPGPGCAAGSYGAAGEQESFLGCVNATTQAASWTAWQDFTGSSCTACPATTTETTQQWVPRSDACPIGQTGSITYEAEQVQTRDVSYNCPAGTTTLPAPSTTAWSGWTDTGARRNTVNNCAVSSACWRKAPNAVIPYSGFDGNATHTNISNLARTFAITGQPFTAPDTLWNNGVNQAYALWRMSTMANPDTCSEGEYFRSERAGDNAISGNMMETWICTADSGSGNSACLTPPPTTCNLLAGQVFNWTVGANSCSYTQPTATTVNIGEDYFVTDSSGSTTGDAAFVCEGTATMAPTPNPGATCVASSCTGSPTATRWDATSAPCPAGESGTNAWEYESERSRTCTAGVWGAWSSWTPTGDTRNIVYTCAPATCTGPSSENQWVGTSAACPAGESGDNTWEYELTRTRTCTAGAWTAWSSWTSTGATRNAVYTCAPSTCSGPSSQTQWLATSANCPAASWGSTAWEYEQIQNRTCTAGVWGAWGSWTNTGATRNASGSCTACPGSSTETSTRWVASSASCPVGQSGSHTWEREQSGTRSVTYSCPAGTTTAPSPSYGAWGGWTDTGNTRNVVNTCAPSGPSGRCTMGMWWSFAGSPFGAGYVTGLFNPTTCATDPVASMQLIMWDGSVVAIDDGAGSQIPATDPSVAEMLSVCGAAVNPAPFVVGDAICGH